MGFVFGVKKETTQVISQKTVNCFLLAAKSRYLTMQGVFSLADCIICT